MTIPQPSQQPRTNMSTNQIIGASCLGCLGLFAMLVLFAGCVSALSGDAPDTSDAPTIVETVTATEEVPVTATETVTATATEEVEVTVTATETVRAESGTGSDGGGSSGGASAYYENCDAARAAGAAPVRRGEPGYGRHLDRDGDGVGCE
ncbi:excalibur calcium-binding domain-containing protein [Nocardiopsis lucentensis]|uniref:excalibur calcium-binding domain-containing protein n=1 Tax=Nocardiopsis lucentensis TaxID=53441 RepID=UPI0003637616|nr:excalibur calcium-binding domain-containing protein [Nocardiopsis lucentensis]